MATKKRTEENNNNTEPGQNTTTTTTILAGTILKEIAMYSKRLGIDENKIMEEVKKEMANTTSQRIALQRAIKRLQFQVISETETKEAYLIRKHTRTGRNDEEIGHAYVFLIPKDTEIFILTSEKELPTGITTGKYYRIQNITHAVIKARNNTEKDRHVYMTNENTDITELQDKPIIFIVDDITQIAQEDIRQATYHVVAGIIQKVNSVFKDNQPIQLFDFKNQQVNMKFACKDRNGNPFTVKLDGEPMEVYIPILAEHLVCSENDVLKMKEQDIRNGIQGLEVLFVGRPAKMNRDGTDYYFILMDNRSTILPNTISL